MFAMAACGRDEARDRTNAVMLALAEGELGIAGEGSARKNSANMNHSYNDNVEGLRGLYRLAEVL